MTSFKSIVDCIPRLHTFTYSRPSVSIHSYELCHITVLVASQAKDIFSLARRQVEVVDTIMNEACLTFVPWALFGRCEKAGLFQRSRALVISRQAHEGQSVYLLCCIDPFTSITINLYGQRIYATLALLFRRTVWVLCCLSHFLVCGSTQPLLYR